MYINFELDEQKSDMIKRASDYEKRSGRAFCEYYSLKAANMVIEKMQREKEGKEGK